MTGGYGITVFEQHAKLLEDSAIPPELARAREYVSVDTLKRVRNLRVVKAATVPGLLIPLRDKAGSVWGYQYRPDVPRTDAKGRQVKYETPWQQRNGIDVPPGVGPKLDDPAVPLWITEGTRKADAAANLGLACISLSGVDCWRGTNAAGGKVALPEWADVALNGRRVVLAFDGDVTRKPSVCSALVKLAAYLSAKGAKVEYLWLPDGDTKVGLDDYIAAGHGVDDLWTLVHPDLPPVAEQQEMPEEPESSAPPAAPVPLAAAVEVFKRWLHLGSDEAPVLVVAATIVANRADGDPVWVLIVGPSSGGKTEIISAVYGLPYVRPVAIITEAALLSGTATKDRAKDATGGLLRQVGKFGILVCKDFTSVLAQNKDTARQAIAALREVYDGSWDRPVGTDGGRVLSWKGKAGFLGGVTPSYDRYSQIVTALGDRFMLLRLPDVEADEQADSALDHDEHEKTMRAELAAAMHGLIAGADPAAVHRKLTDAERQRLIRLASFTARARTAVERNGYTQEVEVIPQAEGPARLVKAMRRLHGGLEAIGADEETRWDVLGRVARDCVPAARTPIMRTLLADGGRMRTAAIAEDVDMVTKTCHRYLDDLALLKIVKRSKGGKADNSPNMWAATEWLRESWPAEVGLTYTSLREEEREEGTANDGHDDDEQAHPRTFQSYSEPPLWPEDWPSEPPDPEWSVDPPSSERCAACPHLLPRPRDPGTVLCHSCAAIAELAPET